VQDPRILAWLVDPDENKDKRLDQLCEEVMGLLRPRVLDRKNEYAQDLIDVCSFVFLFFHCLIS